MKAEDRRPRSLAAPLSRGTNGVCVKYKSVPPHCFSFYSSPLSIQSAEFAGFCCVWYIHVLWFEPFTLSEHLTEL